MTGGPVDHSANAITDEEREMKKLVDPFIQRAMRRGWRHEKESVDGAALIHDKLKLDGAKVWARVIITASKELDGKAWVHLSASQIIRKRGFGGKTFDIVVLPSWALLTKVRDEILGREKKCLVVVAPSKEHVNIAEVHHLWHCPEGDGLPDFTRGSGSI